MLVCVRQELPLLDEGGYSSGTKRCLTIRVVNVTLPAPKREGGRAHFFQGQRNLKLKQGVSTSGGL